MKRLLPAFLLLVVGLTACESESVVSPLVPDDPAPSFAKNEFPDFEPPEECPANGCLLAPTTLTRDAKAPLVWEGEFASASEEEVELVVYASNPKTTTVKAWLNDEVILLPSAFPRAKSDEVRVAFLPEEGDVLRVRLSGKPGTQVAFWVEEVQDEGGAGEEPETPEPEDPEQPPAFPTYVFGATPESYGIDSELSGICSAQFPGSQVADWNDVVAAVEEYGMAESEILDSGYALVLKDGIGVVGGSLFTQDSHYTLSAFGAGSAIATIGQNLALFTQAAPQPVLCVTITP